MAAAHHAYGCVEELLHRHVGESRSVARGERGDEGAGQSRAEDVAAYAYHRGRIEHRVDAGFGMIAHDKAAELQFGAFESAQRIVPQPYEVVGVFKVGCHAASAQVAP